jgi:hypothetical protein
MYTQANILIPHTHTHTHTETEHAHSEKTQDSLSPNMAYLKLFWFSSLEDWGN